MNLLKFVLLTIIVLLPHHYSMAEETQHQVVYIGIAGPSEGAGMMGHLFLLFTNKPNQFLNSIAYQYTVKIPDDFQFSIKELSQISTFPFIVSKLPGWGFIKNYNNEGRYIHLFELKLSNSQVIQLQKNLEKDLKLRDSLQYFDYSILTNNCATKVYDNINALFGETVIPYSNPVEAVYNFSFINPSTVAIAVPLSAPLNLSKNPIVKNMVKFRSEEMVTIETNLVGARELEHLSQLCKLSKDTFNSLLLIFGNNDLRENKFYLNFIDSIFNNCVNKNLLARSKFNYHLDFLRYKSQNQKFIEIVKKYYK